MHVSCFSNLHTCYDLTRFPRVVCVLNINCSSQILRECVYLKWMDKTNGRGRIMTYKLPEGRDLICLAHGFTFA